MNAAVPVDLSPVVVTMRMTGDELRDVDGSSVVSGPVFFGRDLPRRETPRASHFLFELSEGITLRSTAPLEGDHYAPAPDDVFVVGDYQTREVQVGEARVHVLANDEDLGDVAALIERALITTQARAGSPSGTLLLLLEEGPPRVTHQRGIARIVSEELSADLTSPSGRAILDAVHTLYTDAPEAWFRLGLARWLSNGARAELSDREGASIADVLESYRFYRRWALRGESPAAAEGVEAMHAGSLVAFCADARLRAQGTSIANVLRGARGEGELLSEFWSSLSRETATEMRARIAFRGVMVFQSCLSRVGWRLRARDFESLSGATLSASFGIAESLVVARDAAALRAGDRVIALRGVPVRGVDEIALLLSDVATGAEFSIDVARGDSRARVMATMPEVTRERMTFTFAEPAPE